MGRQSIRHPAEWSGEHESVLEGWAAVERCVDGREQRRNGCGPARFATDLRGGDTPADGQFIWEWWYQFQVTDTISITPALFCLSRPMGELTPDGSTFQQLGGLIKTTFVF